MRVEKTVSRMGQDYCDVLTATGEYSCLQVDLVFARELSYFLVTMYVPCIMIVVVSWFAFWIDHKSAPARVTLGVSTLLALSTTLASIQKSLPPVAYMKVLCLLSSLLSYCQLTAKAKMIKCHHHNLRCSGD